MIVVLTIHVKITQRNIITFGWSNIMLDTIIGIIFLIPMALFAYIGCHMSEEKRAGKYLPLFWEKDGMGYKIFNKSDVKYTDGDNT